MSVVVLVERTCDRCLRLFSAKKTKELDKDLAEDSSYACVRRTRSGTTEEVMFLFDDVCSDCEKVIRDYFLKIRMVSETTTSTDSTPSSPTALKLDPETPAEQQSSTNNGGNHPF